MKPVLILAVALVTFALPAAAAPRKPACCRIPAGTVVMVELAVPVGTKTQKAGDTFAIRLAEPVIVGGRLILPAGAPGVGEVIESAKPGLGGKAAKLVLAARSLTPRRGVTVPLKGLQLSGAGRSQSNASNAVGIAGIAFAPLGVAAFAIKGGDVQLPAGTQATAKLASAVVLPSRGKAPKDAAASITESGSAELDKGEIRLRGPLRGMGQIVFFRRKSLLGTGQWFNVREDGKAVGKLTNGVYFTEDVTPGLHTFTAKTEPEFKDSLKLKIEAGETYFVEGVLTKGVVIGVPDLSPSDRAAFNVASKGLKPAP